MRFLILALCLLIVFLAFVVALENEQANHHEQDDDQGNEDSDDNAQVEVNVDVLNDVHEGQEQEQQQQQKREEDKDPLIERRISKINEANRCEYIGPIMNHAIGGCTFPHHTICRFFNSLNAAYIACDHEGPTLCSGVTKVSDHRYELRRDGVPFPVRDSGEVSYLRVCSPLLEKVLERVPTINKLNSKDHTTWLTQQAAEATRERRIRESNAANDEQNSNKADPSEDIETLCNRVTDKPPPLPEEYLLPSNTSIYDVGYNVDGQPSIFISIASYRDDLCAETVKDALIRAKYPKRVFFGIVEQNAPGDRDCGCTSSPKVDDPTSADPRCRYSSQIRTDFVAAKAAAGPTYARARAHRLYRGETFILQIDAHMKFVPNWDTYIIKQWKDANNEMAVLTGYPTEAVGNIDSWGGKGRIRTVPVMCKARPVLDCIATLEGAQEIVSPIVISGKTGMKKSEFMQKMAESGQQLLQPFRIQRRPFLHVYWAAGLSFARGHFALNVPYDPYTPMVFIGEEILMTSRAWTRGYDMYAFAESVVYHYYPFSRLKLPPLFNDEIHHVCRDFIEQKSLQRLNYVLGVEDQEPSDFDRRDASIGEKYGLGTKRNMTHFMQIFGMKFLHGKYSRPAKKPCDFNKLLHDEKYKEKFLISSNNICIAAYSGQLHSFLSQFRNEIDGSVDYSKMPCE